MNTKKSYDNLNGKNLDKNVEKEPKYKSGNSTKVEKIKQKISSDLYKNLK